MLEVFINNSIIKARRLVLSDYKDICASGYFKCLLKLPDLEILTMIISLDQRTNPELTHLSVLPVVAPGDVGQYFARMTEDNRSAAQYFWHRMKNFKEQIHKTQMTNPEWKSPALDFRFV